MKMGNSVKENYETIQRAELHRKIWAIADDVRGAVDGWDFKQYILGILFYRFISENMRDYFNKAEREAGDVDFNYADISDEEALKDFKPGIVEEKGFFILPSQLFENVVKNINPKMELNAKLKEIFDSIEGSAIGTDSEEDFKGLFRDVDVTSDRLGETVTEKNAKLTSILVGISELNFGNFEDNHIDTFGDAYEYLISNYASNAGKSGGEFFTPQTVSRLLAKLVVDGKDKINKVYDPTCGSGSLLLQMRKFEGVEIEEGYYGQEINLTNYNLARMNMFLHNVNYNDFSIKRGDTLLNPQHGEERPFDAIVSNPPYSIKWIGDADPTLINDERFAPAGKLAPKSYADYAFIMHSLSYLSSKGRAAIVCFPGIFYRKGAERTIRKYLVDNNFVNNIDNIIEEFRNRADVEYFSRYVDNSEIEKNDYNLSVSTYVEKEDTREKIDIKVLNKEIAETVKKIDELRASIDEIVRELEDDE